MSFTPVIAFPRLIVYSRVMTSAGFAVRPMVVARERETDGSRRAGEEAGGACACLVGHVVFLRRTASPYVVESGTSGSSASSGRA